MALDEIEGALAKVYRQLWLTILGRDLTKDERITFAFVRRGESLWRALIHATEGPSEAGVQVVMRAIAEATITLPWLMLAPDVHVTLWEADSSYRIVRWGLPATDRRGWLRPGERAEIEALHREKIDAAKKALRHLGEPIPGIDAARGRFLPSLQQRAIAIGNEAVFDVYELAYPLSSNWTHSGPGSFRNEEGGPENPRGARLEAAAHLVMLFAEAGRLLGGELGPAIEQRCADLASAIAGAD